MFCAFHPSNAATAQCTGCNRPLCAVCDHRIKAHPYCEDCIVRGVEVLRRPAAPVVAPNQHAPRVPRNAPGAAKAALLAIIPGLGAVYNRQNLKALLHFVGTVGLVEISDATDLAFFGIGGAVFFLYTVIDAHRTARAIAAGADPSEDERRIKWLFARYKPVWGALLLVVAVIAALSSLTALPVGLTPARLWALILFVAGSFMIFSYFRSLRDEEPRSFATPPRSVVSSMLPGDVDRVTTYQEGRHTSHLGDR